MPRIIIYIVLIALALPQTACGLPQGVSREELEAKGAELNALSRSRIVAVLDEPYLGARPVPITKNDEFSSGVFARHITINRQGSLVDICAAVTKMTGLAISVDAAASRPLTQANASGGAVPKDSDMDAQLAAALGLGQEGAAPAAASPEQAAEQPKSAKQRGGVRIAYDGTVKGLLDLLSSRFGLAWEYNPATGVVFSTTAIRTFTIWAAPGAISYSNNITNASKESNSGGGGSTGTGVSSAEMSNETAQTNTTSLSFDVWKDIEEGVKQLLSPAGSVISSQAAGTITVKDTAPSLNRIEEYIEEANERLARQVALSIKVWSLEISDSVDIGLSLAMFFENPDVRVFAGAGASLLNWQKQGGELSAAIVDGKLRDSTSLLKALRSVGRATQVTSGGGVVMNNQPIPIQAVKREAYLASSSMTTTETGETSSLTPGEITTGFAMTVIPHVLEGRRVVLQYTVNLSSLDDLAEFSSGDSTIQLPKVSTRSYSQRMTIKMGQTLVLAGFEQEIGSSNSAGGILGFGRGRDYKKSLMVITISAESGDV